jgi:phosphoglycolate phosphatase-like HAD superfamily hydrolase
MNSILGRAPVVDFDGTVAVLDVPWGDLRTRLEVQRIDELWARPGDGWGLVASAEEDAAARAAPVLAVVEALREAHAVAVLTSNSEASVRRFLGRHDELQRVVVAVIGRESLAGPKSDYDVFARGFQKCVDATAGARRSGEKVVYVGDQSYELHFARKLGAHAVHVKEVAGR